MKYRILCVLLSLLMILSLSSCKGKKSDEAEATPFPTHSGLLGYIVYDSGEIEAYTAMHGFIKTVEGLCKNAKLYKFKTQEEFLTSVDMAISERADVVVDCDCGFETQDSIKKLKAAGLSVICNGEKSTVANAYVTVSDTEHYSEIALLIAQQAESKKHTEGTILIYSTIDYNGETTVSEIISEFKKAYSDSEIAFDVMNLSSVAEEKSVLQEELKNTLDQRKTIYGVFALTDKATESAKGAVKSMDKTGDITIISADYSEKTISLIGSGIYGAAVKPTYDMLCNATRMLSETTEGKQPESIRMGYHILNENTVGKYSAIIESVKNWFGIKES